MKKKLLLTGATGFLGSHIFKALIESDYDVIILKRSFSSLEKIKTSIDNLSFINIDKDPLEDAFKKFGKIDCVIHTACDYGKDSMVGSVIEANVLFPSNLLQCAIDNNVPLFINTDTFFRKQKEEYLYLKEYITSKRHFIDWSKILFRKSKISFINMVLEHIYGTEDSPHKFFPKMIIDLVNNVNEISLTQGTQKRDFIFVTDVVSAYLKVLNNFSANSWEEYEVGNGRSISIFDLLQKIKTITKSSTNLCFGSLDHRGFELMDSFADTTKLSRIGWQAKFSLDEGIKICVHNVLKNKYLKKGK